MPDLSERVKSRLRAVRDRLRERGWRTAQALMPCPDFLKVANDLLRDAGGGRRISRYMAPP